MGRFIKETIGLMELITIIMVIGIPWRINSENIGLNKAKRLHYFNIIGILNQYIDEQTISKENYKKLIITLNMPEDKTKTIQYVLDMYIKAFLKRCIDFEEQNLNVYQGMGLYIQKRNAKKDICNKVINYLECYVGERNFGIDILFISGSPSITFSM